MTDYNVRDIFFLFTGRCGHKWVADEAGEACPTCGDCGMPVRGGGWGKYEHVIAEEPIAVNFARVLLKIQRRIQWAIRANRRKKRKTAHVISLAAHRPGPPPPGP